MLKLMRRRTTNRRVRGKPREQGCCDKSGLWRGAAENAGEVGIRATNGRGLEPSEAEVGRYEIGRSIRAFELGDCAVLNIFEFQM